MIPAPRSPAKCGHWAAWITEAASSFARPSVINTGFPALISPLSRGQVLVLERMDREEGGRGVGGELMARHQRQPPCRRNRTPAARFPGGCWRACRRPRPRSGAATCSATRTARGCSAAASRRSSGRCPVEASRSRTASTRAPRPAPSAGPAPGSVRGVRAVGIVPAAAALGAADAAQPAHDEIALVLRRAAPALVAVVARLGAHPDAVEVGRLAQHLVAALVELVVPLRILDDQPGLGIDALGGCQHPRPATAAPSARSGSPPRYRRPRARSVPPTVTVFGPPRRIALRAGAVGEPEIVDHDLVEQDPAAYSKIAWSRSCVGGSV